MIPISTLQKAVKVVNEIQLLDAEIITIEKLAMMVANGDVKSNLCLTIEESVIQDEAHSEPESTVTLMDFNSVMQGFLMSRHFEPNIENKKGNEFKSILSEMATMGVLGVLLADKKGKRESLVHSLLHLGIETN